MPGSGKSGMVLTYSSIFFIDNTPFTKKSQIHNHLI